MCRVLNSRLSESHSDSVDRGIFVKNAPAAADWLSKELIGATKAQEMLAHRDAMLQFGVEVAATNSHVKDKENILHSLL